MQIQPYLFFEGRAEEAVEFYKRTVGAEVVLLMRYADSPPGAESAEGCPGAGAMPQDKVMHATLRIGESTVQLSDGMCTGAADFRGFSLSLAVKDDAEAARVFDALGNGGEVKMPLAATFFASSFGMVADRFGMTWMVIRPLQM